MQLNYDQKSRVSLILFISTAVFVIILSSVAIIGWMFKAEQLQSVFPHYVAMKFNTALCFILSAVSFILIVKYQHPPTAQIVYILLATVAAIGLITLSEHAFNWSAGIDQLFVADNNSFDIRSPHPGRMAISTALCFVSWAFSFSVIQSENRSLKIAAQYLLHLVALISFIAVLAYLLNVPFSANFSFFSAMAINTSVAFLSLSIVASTVNPEIGITALFTDTQIGNTVVAKKLYPRLMAVLFIIGYSGVVLQRKGYIIPEFSIVISTVLFLLISLYLIRGTLTEMNDLDEKRSEAEKRTRFLNQELEYKVLARTRELERNKEWFFKIFNASPVGIAITRLGTGEYVDVNPAVLTLLDYEPAEIIGNTSTNLAIISPEYRGYMVKSLDEKGFMKNEDSVLIDKHGNEKHCLLSAEIIKRENEKFLMSFVFDITDRKLAENKLQETKKELEVLADKLSSQNKQLLSFAHIISHNLRSPVSNLNLLVHLYKESVDDQDRAELWGNFETVTQHLNTTLDELLETLRIQEDTTKERENLSFEKVFTGIREMLIGQIIDSKAVIKADFSKATHVYYPKIYLESIMLNLISNAIKYRSPDRVPHISIMSDDHNGEISLSVQDNGLGIDLNRHAKNLFGMRKTFHRHAEAKGLGLFITKTQMEAMGGEITAESEVDKGTKFTVIFNKIKP
jgi:PAS domain S-box-containing protein